MKRLITFGMVVLMLLTGVALAEIPDLTVYTDEELAELLEKTQAEQARRLAEKYGYTEMKKYDAGEEVEYLQTRLTELGYYAGKIDGIYGGGTERSLIGFQERNGLETTGIATVETLALLYSDEARSTVDNLIENLNLDGNDNGAGLKYVPLENGSYRIIGTSENAGVFGLNPTGWYNDEDIAGSLETILILQAGETYYISGCQVCYTEEGDPAFKVYNASKENATADTAMEVTPERDQYVKQIRAWYAAGEHDGSIVYEPMISKTKPVKYEPYVED